MPYTDLSDVRLFYTDDGPREAETLLLVHGFAADSHDWIWHIPTLARTYRVIAVDQRGHGYSGAPETGYAPGDFARDLAGLLDHLGIERAVAFGHSMGGLVVSTLAVDYPGKVRALVCVDAAYGKPDAFGPFLLKQTKAAADDPYGVALSNEEWCHTPASPPFLKDWHRRKILGTSPAALSQAYAGIFGEGTVCLRGTGRDFLLGRECPVLSFSFDPEQSAWEQELFTDPRSAAVTWPGSGHRLHEERPGEFLLVVEKWLGTLDTGLDAAPSPRP